MSQLPHAILIAGPTASGKSALAVALAERLGGTIINADSMQVYGDLRILSARPGPEDEARAPHLLFGHVDAATAYSAGQYGRDAKCALDDVRASGRVPIFVGGTGLYFKVLLEGLSPVPEISADVRGKWRRAAMDMGAEKLHAELARHDPTMAERLAPTDRQRMVRALEVKDQTGRSLAEWQSMPGTPILVAERMTRLVIDLPREVLHARADARFANMLETGAAGEVQRLMARSLDPGLPAMRALGVAPIAAWLDGRLDRQAAIERGQTETRQYIKRQATWLKKNMISWKSISTQQMESQMADLLKFIEF